jgi:GTP-binding protein
MLAGERYRNIAIIAHVDHGKTTLVDELLKQSGTFRNNQVLDERLMDSMDLEKEKGITIKAKNTSVRWRDHTINIVDTPGHADFGAEVERVMKMVDGVLLLVDAYEGAQAQTRFVLKKALANDLKPIVVINKIDRENSRPEYVHDTILELLLELGADEEQFGAPFIYGSARDGYMVHDLEDEHNGMEPLFDTIVKHIPPPEIEQGDFRMLVSNIDWDNFVGRVGVGRVLSGSVKVGDSLYVLSSKHGRNKVKVTKVFEYSGISTQDSATGEAGNIVGISGFEELDIGDTLVADPEGEALPFIAIDPPTIQMEFAINNGPFAGRDGKKVTSRQIRERLEREMKSNISIQVEDASEGGRFLVSARGAMQIAVLVETMRREGYEVLVSRPTVILKEEDGKKLEPWETIWVEIPQDATGGVMQQLSDRKATIKNMEPHATGVTIEASIPTRGLIGFETELVNLTSGEGVMSHLFESYKPHLGKLNTRQTGTLVSMDQGQSTAYALDALQDRGKLFIAPGDEVYVGMVVGENPRLHDLPVNPTKGKQLTNVRASGSDKGIILAPPIRFSLERAIEYIGSDEFVEATPEKIRLRKRILDPNARKRAEKREEA